MFTSQGSCLLCSSDPLKSRLFSCQREVKEVGKKLRRASGSIKRNFSLRSTSLPDHGERSLLHRDLMEGYEKYLSRYDSPLKMFPISYFHYLIWFIRDVIPMKAAPNADNDANAVVFNLGASVIRMDMKNLESDELQPVLEMTSWLRMSWMDFRLKWNPQVHCAYSQDILYNRRL